MPKPGFLSQDIPLEVMPTIIDEYLGGSFDAEARRNAVQEFWADLMVIFPTLNFSRNLRGEPIPVHLPYPSHFGPGVGLS